MENNSSLNLFSLTTPGLEAIAQQEIKEILAVPSTISPSVIEFSVKTKAELIHYLYHAQAVRRIIISLGKFKDTGAITFDPAFPWADFFTSELSFKVEVENISGQENRFALAKDMATKLYTILRPLHLEPQINLKKPDFLIIVFYNGKNYFLGIDVAGKELNSRDYRVFLHPASCKGDLAYYFVRKSGFIPGEKIVVGLCKDGTIAIEAALFVNKLLLYRTAFSFQKFSGFKAITDQNNISPSENTLFAFDNYRTNIIASKKNAKLAGAFKYIEFQQLQLEEISTHYSEQKFAYVIIYLTAKDVNQLNEIVYQIKFILKTGGTVLLVSKEGFELPVPDEFTLRERSSISKGGQHYSLHLLGKKP